MPVSEVSDFNKNKDIYGKLMTIHFSLNLNRPGSSPKVLISFPHFYGIGEEIRFKNSLIVEGLSPNIHKHSSYITIDRVRNKLIVNAEL